MLKNIYNLGVRNLDNNPSSIPEFNIYYTPPSGTAEKDYNGSGPANGRSYLNLVKLDIRINGSPTIVPEGDNQFDFFPGTTIDRVNGNVIFPTIRPFSYTLKEAGVDSIHIGKNDTIYESSKTTAQQFGNIKFTLVGKAKGEALLRRAGAPIPPLFPRGGEGQRQHRRRADDAPQPVLPDEVRRAHAPHRDGSERPAAPPLRGDADDR